MYEHTYEQYMDTNEVKEYLRITNFTFKKLMKENKLTPINKDTWRLDGSFLFQREEVTALQSQLHIEGITLNQASKQFHISMYQLWKWIEEGELTYTIQLHRNKETRFVQEEDVKNLAEKLDDANSLYTYSRKYNLVLFQKFIQGNTIARITSIPKRGNIIVTDEFGNDMTLQEAEERGFLPAYQLSDKPRSHHQKFVKFRFLKTHNLRSDIFQRIDFLLQYVSPRNLRISEEHNFWIIEIRQSLIQVPMQFQQEWIDSLMPYIIEGKLVKRPNNSIYLDSNSVTKSIVLSSSEYKSISNIVNEEKISIEEFIVSAVREKLGRYTMKH
ncbi:DNA-binding protein [Bacillus sp. CGMCC 1.60114]|uniref:DNA-binding protein n=1 Tax=unclassified Bacillus (in: firmicutes) TaxID=185979 RepID=UPI00363758AC